MTAVVNEAGERFEFALDAVGRVTRERGFDGRTRQYVRDTAGRPTLTILPSGRTTKSRYDALDRLIEATHSDGSFARFDYGPDGLLTRASSSSRGGCPAANDGPLAIIATANAPIADATLGVPRWSLAIAQRLRRSLSRAE